MLEIISIEKSSLAFTDDQVKLCQLFKDQKNNDVDHIYLPYEHNVIVQLSYYLIGAYEFIKFSNLTSILKYVKCTKKMSTVSAEILSGGLEFYLLDDMVKYYYNKSNDDIYLILQKYNMNQKVCTGRHTMVYDSGIVFTDMSCTPSSSSTNYNQIYFCIKPLYNAILNKKTNQLQTDLFACLFEHFLENT